MDITITITNIPDSDIGTFQQLAEAAALLGKTVPIDQGRVDIDFTKFKNDPGVMDYFIQGMSNMFALAVHCASKT